MTKYSNDNWYREISFNGKYSSGYLTKSLLHQEQSKFQKIEVLDTYAVGKLLLLDGKTMVSDKDEFVYHEVMAHIPLSVLRNCQHVLIIGGGDGGIIRELVKYDEIQSIDLVEIDERVIEVSKKYFPHVTSGLSDSRVRILAEDGTQYIKNPNKIYDLIIVDSTDPQDFAQGLFTNEFYSDVYAALSDQGIMMNQTENPFLDEFDIKKIYQNMRRVFPIVRSFSAPMLIYPGVFWTFGFSSKKFMPNDLNSTKKRFITNLERSLRWYNQQWHQGAFAISNFHKKMIGQE